jgi:hypothetical protein
LTQSENASILKADPAIRLTTALNTSRIALIVDAVKKRKM